jgi:hypothetical protein
VGGAVITSDQYIVAVGRPQVGTAVMAYNGFPIGAANMYVPMLFSHAFGGSYDAALYIQNVSASSIAHITIKYYDSTNGNLTCARTDTVAPFASKGYWIPSECVPTGWVGGATIISDQPVVAVGRPHIGSVVTSYDGFAGGATDVYVPMLFSQAFGGSYNAALYVQDVDRNNPAHITVEYRDSTGALTCSRTDTIPALSSHGYWIPSECVPSGWVGGAHITSDKPIVAVGRPHIDTAVTAYDGFNAGTQKGSAPMLFSAAFGGSYNAALYIQNMGSADANVTMDFYDSSGVKTCSQPATILNHASQGFWLPSISCLPSGWVGGVQITSNQPVAVVGRPHVGSAVASYQGWPVP